MVIVKKTNKQTKQKERREKRRRKQSEARRQKLVAGLVETSYPPVQPAWYVNSTFMDRPAVYSCSFLSGVVVCAAAALNAVLGLLFKES